MELEGPVPLAGKEIHGFDTSADLDYKKLTEDASKRWLRPNEVYAVLSNYTLFKIQPQPVDIPPSGSLLLFDRKVLRNFRKDGHNWRKKKDGKTVQEAHEKLKIGNEERIHVYYARNEDDPNFYRRCYWLLDRNLERIVLVHYRQTSEETASQLLPLLEEPKDAFHLTTSPIASSTSATDSNISEIPACRVLREEINSGGDYAPYAGCQLSPTGNLTECGNHEFSLNEIEGISWNDMMKEASYIDSMHKNGNVTSNDQDIQYQLQNANYHGTLDQEMPSIPQPNCSLPAIYGYCSQMNSSRTHTQFGIANASAQELTDGRASLAGDQSTDFLIDNVFQDQNNMEKWAKFNDPAGSSHDSGSQFQASDSLNVLPVAIHSSCQGEVYNVVDVSPAYAYSMEETKIVVVGYFNDSHRHLEDSNVYCIFGSRCILAEKLKAGIYRVMTLPHQPGLVEFYFCIDGHTPISKVMNFEFRSLPSTPSDSAVTSPEVCNELPARRDSDVLIRLTHMLFSTTNAINVLSSKISPNSMKEAKKFMSLTTMENQWKRFLDDNKNESRSPENQELFDLVLKDKFQEWLLLRIAEGCRTAIRDKQGQGVIHLCAILDYAWAIRMFSLSGLPLDFRDVHGWTALHWAAYYGREKTAAALLYAGANPSLVSDPSPDYPGGCTAADLASQEGYEGLGAYLAEKGLRAHFQAMALSGNAVAQMRQSSIDRMRSANIDGEILSEQELCLKDSLAAYRNAADAADRIQSAFRERSLKQQMKATRMIKPEHEAESIVAALKIQKAFRNYNRRKLMKAAIRIQGTFRTWQARKNFLNLRRQVIRIQAVFRGHLERRQYQKIIWSVGVLEKAVLRWRMKRKGLRGLQAETAAQGTAIEEENCVEEEFFRVSREQAEERVKRSVVRVQAMFRSYRAQQEYRRMKLAYNEAQLEYGNFADLSRQF